MPGCWTPAVCHVAQSNMERPGALSPKLNPKPLWCTYFEKDMSLCKLPVEVPCYFVEGRIGSQVARKRGKDALKEVY